MKLLSAAAIVRSMTPEDFNFDYAMRVPVISIVLMVISIVLCFAVPIYLIVRLKNRFRFELYAFTYGLIAYMLGIALLPSGVDFLLTRIPAVSKAFEANPAVEQILYTLFVVCFTFLACLIGLKFALKKANSIFCAAALFAIAMGVMPILTQGLTYQMNYISAAISVNQGQLSQSVASMIENGTSTADIQAGLDSMAEFINMSPSYFLYLGTDMILQLLTLLGICLSLACYLGRSSKASLYRSFVSIGIYGIFYGLRCCNVITNATVTELLFLIVALISLYLAYTDLGIYLHDDLRKFLGKPDPNRRNKTPDSKPGDKPHKMPKIVMPKD